MLLKNFDIHQQQCHYLFESSDRLVLSCTRAMYTFFKTDFQLDQMFFLKKPDQFVNDFLEIDDKEAVVCIDESIIGVCDVKNGESLKYL